MQSVFVRLPSPEVVQSFVEDISGLEGDFDLVAGGYILDARSLMGIFSLDLSQRIELKVYNDTRQNMQAIAKYIDNNDSPPKSEKTV